MDIEEVLQEIPCSLMIDVSELISSDVEPAKDILDDIVFDYNSKNKNKLDLKQMKIFMANDWEEDFTFEEFDFQNENARSELIEGNEVTINVFVGFKKVMTLQCSESHLGQILEDCIRIVIYGWGQEIYNQQQMNEEKLELMKFNGDYYFLENYYFYFDSDQRFYCIKRLAESHRGSRKVLLNYYRGQYGRKHEKFELAQKRRNERRMKAEDCF